MVPSVGMTPHVGIARMHPGPRIALERVLDAHEEKGERERAIAALRQEIPDFDGRVEKERARASVKVEAAKDPHARPGNANAKKENNAVNNVNPESKRSKKAGNNAEYIIARLKRDAATDTHAAALLGSIEAPSASWCPQVPPGQATPHSPLTLDSQGLRRRLTGSRVFRKSGKPGKEKAPIIADRGLCVIGAKDFAPFLCFRLATKNPIQCCGHFVGLYALVGFLVYHPVPSLQSD